MNTHFTPIADTDEEISKAVDPLYRETSPCCVTITLNTSKSNRKELRTAIKSATANAIQLLTNIPCDPDIRERTIENIGSIRERNIRPDGSAIGWYVSPEITSFFRFPFPVIDRVLVGPGFRLAELARLAPIEVPFHMLLLSAQSAHLYHFQPPYFDEITASAFPVYADTDYEYARPSRGSSFGSAALKAFEREKTDILSLRTQSMLRDADQRLAAYIADMHARIVVAGPPRLVNQYKSTTAFSSQLVAAVYGSYSTDQVNDLETKSRKAVAAAIEAANELYAKSLWEHGTPPVSGLDESWQAVYNGRAMCLFLNADLHERGYVSDNSLEISLYRTPSHHRETADIISEMIRLAHNRNTQVVMLPGSVMRRFDDAFVQLRY